MSRIGPAAATEANFSSPFLALSHRRRLTSRLHPPSGRHRTGTTSDGRHHRQDRGHV